MYTARPVWPGCWQRRTCWTFWQGRATPPAPQTSVFLGYPLADVIGFIQNRGKNFTACGYWKVYTDPTAAQAEFDRYKKCERIYARCYYNGTPIRRLTVAA